MTWAYKAAAAALLMLLALPAHRICDAAACYESFTETDFPQCQLLTPGYALHWRIASSNLTVGIAADTGATALELPWVGLGISELGGMRGADIALVHLADTSTGTWALLDLHSASYSQPLPDAKQDWALLAQPVFTGRTILAVLERALSTCDADDQLIQPELPTSVIWALGSGWPAYHGPVSRGNARVTFGSPTNTSAATAAAPALDAALTADALLQQQSGAAPAGITSTLGVSTDASAGNATATTQYAALNVADAVGNSISAALAGVMHTMVTIPANTPASTGTIFNSSSADGHGGSSGASGSAPSSAHGAALTDLYSPTPPIPTTVAGLAAASGTSDAKLQAQDVLMPQLSIPAAETTYLCTHVVLPRDQKYHIVAAQSLVHSPLLHHMILYGCATEPDQLGDLMECLSMPPNCQVYTMGWAPGVPLQTYPPQAGLPIGTGGLTYYMLQAHYNNPLQLEGQMDPGSGFRLFFTPILRPNDLGILMVGQPILDIPANTSAYTAPPNVCPAECTRRFPSDVTIVSATPHMHTIGRSIQTQHIRGPHELVPLGRRQYFDFNFQGAIPLPPDAGASGTLAPGDALVTTCTFDSTGRTAPTKFGEASTSEMCFTFILYWPRVPNIEVCTTLRAGAAFCSVRSDLVALKLETVGRVPTLGEGLLRSGYASTAATTGSLLAQYLSDGRMVMGTVPSRYRRYDECPSLEASPWHV